MINHYTSGGSSKGGKKSGKKYGKYGTIYVLQPESENKFKIGWSSEGGVKGRSGTIQSGRGYPFRVWLEIPAKTRRAEEKIHRNTPKFQNLNSKKNGGPLAKASFEDPKTQRNTGEFYDINPHQAVSDDILTHKGLKDLSNIRRFLIDRYEAMEANSFRLPSFKGETQLWSMLKPFIPFFRNSVDFPIANGFESGDLDDIEYAVKYHIEEKPASYQGNLNFSFQDLLETIQNSLDVGATESKKQVPAKAPCRFGEYYEEILRCDNADDPVREYRDSRELELYGSHFRVVPKYRSYSVDTFGPFQALYQFQSLIHDLLHLRNLYPSMKVSILGE